MTLNKKKIQFNNKVSYTDVKWAYMWVKPIGFAIYTHTISPISSVSNKKKPKPKPFHLPSIHTQQ